VCQTAMTGAAPVSCSLGSPDTMLLALQSM